MLRIAARNVRRNRRRSVITLLAMFLALLVLVVVRGGLNGTNAVLRESIIDGQIGALQIHRKGFLRNIAASPLDLDVPADPDFLARLRALPHVRAVAPRIPFGGMTNAHDRSAFALFFAVDPTEEIRVCPKRFDELTSGTPVGPENVTGSDLTQPLLQRLGARLGERAVLLTSDRDGVMNAVEVDVVGTLPDAGVLTAERKVVFLPLATAQELLRMPGRATELAVGVDDFVHIDEVAGSLRAALGSDFEVSTWHDLTSAADDVMDKQDRVMTWIANTFLLVALLGIANTMLMSVRERTREIGTMMAVGMRRRQIVGLFLSEAALIGLCGGALGVLVGGALVHHLGAVGIKMRVTGGTSFFELHPYVTGYYLARSFAIAVLGAMGAALYPALRASRLRPIEALSQVA
jgi:putative ABC transport system permease protein